MVGGAAHFVYQITRVQVSSPRVYRFKSVQKIRILSRFRPFRVKKNISYRVERLKISQNIKLDVFFHMSL